MGCSPWGHTTEQLTLACLLMYIIHKPKNMSLSMHSICQQIWKTQQWPQDWKRSVFIPMLLLKN